ncbi:UNVERIFIED_CONTAM: Light-mediated development protein DET1 [Sesamum calycinum]|uniref:Light-mediated development protein DET1 n=1 Tax=Sesamum calycinum TaxID=2727403 RepID=A0AAW2JDG0_9LAMI
MLSTLPFNCQSQSPSPYFDHSLFRYDDKLISATDRHRQSTDHPIKFISRRQPNILKFKIKPGPESGNADTRTKKISSFLFHPILPLAISVQQTLFLQPAVFGLLFLPRNTKRGGGGDEISYGGDDGVGGGGDEYLYGGGGDGEEADGGGEQSEGGVDWEGGGGGDGGGGDE